MLICSRLTNWPHTASSGREIPRNSGRYLKSFPEDIVRSKGYFIDTGSKWKVFDIVEGSKPVYRDAEEGFSMDRNLAIFIRTKLEGQERAPRHLPG